MEASAANQKQMFVGTEFEGPLSGERTLFIQGDVDLQTITRVLDKYQVEHRLSPVTHLYFGAGRLSTVNLRDVREVLEAVKDGHAVFTSDLKVTVETPASIAHLMTDYSNLYHMVPVSMKDFHGNEITERVTPTLQAYSDLQTILSDVCDRMILKIDTGVSVICIALGECRVNWYQAYSDDKLLWREEEQV